MKVDLGMTDLVHEAITRLNDAELQDLGADTNRWLQLPDIPLIDADGSVLGVFVYDPDGEYWYFKTNDTKEGF